MENDRMDLKATQFEHMICFRIQSTAGSEPFCDIFFPTKIHPDDGKFLTVICLDDEHEWYFESLSEAVSFVFNEFEKVLERLGFKNDSIKSLITQ